MITYLQRACILVCPPRGEVALWLSGYGVCSSGASLLLGAFREAVGRFQHGYRRRYAEMKRRVQYGHIYSLKSETLTTRREVDYWTVLP